jgi:hypothetical protein
MSDMFLKDSKNRWHQVCIQFHDTSCGPACVAMVERLYKHRGKSDEARARQLSEKYPGGWTFGGAGSYPWNVSSVLNAEGVKAYRAENVACPNVRAYLRHYARFSTPVVATVRWYSGAGHFVVCAVRDPDDTFVFYDPFYGLVQQTGAYFPYYYASGGKKTPESSGLGYFDGWLIITYR